MRRLLVWLAIWLGLSFAAAARADVVFPAADGDQITFRLAVAQGNRPPLYCLMSPSDPRFNDLRRGWEGTPRLSSLKAIFIPCDYASSPMIPTWIGYLAVLPATPEGNPSDMTRAAWLKGLQWPETSGVTAHNDELRNGVSYSHAIFPAPRDQFGAISGAQINVNGLTIIKDTPVMLTIVDQESEFDVAAAVTALDTDRTVLRTVLRSFAADNGLDVESAVSTEQVQSAVNLGALLFVYSAGGILLLTLTVSALWLRALAGIGIAVAAALVYQAAPGGPSPLHNPSLDRVMAVGFALALLALGAAVWRLGRLVRPRGLDLTDRLRALVCTDRWNSSLRSPDHGGDLTRRWFVTVAATTGSAVGGLFQVPDFVKDYAAAFGLDRIVFTLLITLVSVTLIGPVEAYVFQSRIAAHGHAAAGDAAPEESTFERMMNLMSPRALLRFLFVLLAMLALTVTHGAVEAHVRDGDADDISALLGVAFGPAVVTYYWCASLQRGARSVAVSAGVAVGVAGLLLMVVPSLAVEGFSVSIARAHLPGWTVFSVAMVDEVIDQLASIALYVATLCAVAYVGGLIINVARRRALSPVATTALVGPVIVLGGLLYVLGQFPIDYWTHGAADPKAFAENLKSAIWPPLGWIVGLVVSGFPRVLETGVLRVGGAAGQAAPS